MVDTAYAIYKMAILLNFLYMYQLHFAVDSSVLFKMTVLAYYVCIKYISTINEQFKQKCTCVI
jgi:hypothetical protein